MIYRFTTASILSHGTKRVSTLATIGVASFLAIGTLSSGGCTTNTEPELGSSAAALTTTEIEVDGTVVDDHGYPANPCEMLDPGGTSECEVIERRKCVISDDFHALCTRCKGRKVWCKTQRCSIVSNDGLDLPTAPTNVGCVTCGGYNPNSNPEKCTSYVP